MPIQKVKGGYKWGSSGKVFKTRKGAEKQAQAAYASGYKKKKRKLPKKKQLAAKTRRKTLASKKKK